ncbi:MAG: VWA domain-containing protein [bacterium]|nr:VWA domain-containing protein [bacterium]
MRFAHPEFIILILLLPAFIGLYVLRRWQQNRSWEHFAESGFKERLLPRYSAGRLRFKLILKCLVMVFVVLALMEPQWGTREEEVQMRGINLMLLVDVSQSMMAGDVKPNRLEREKLKVRDLLRMVSGDRLGIIAFAGRSFLLSPLTVDYGTLERYVDELGPETIPVPGTDLAGAIKLALRSFPEGKEGRAIMIFTDGEDHSQKMKEMEEKLKAEGVKLFVLGIGTPEGAPVPEPGGGFKTDSRGKTVISKLGEDFLKNLALETGGAYARAVSSDSDLKELYVKGVRGALTPTDLRVTKKKVWESRFYWPLGIALSFWLLERTVPDGRRKKRKYVREKH